MTTTLKKNSDLAEKLQCLGRKQPRSRENLMQRARELLVTSGNGTYASRMMPFAALECVECEVYLVDGEIGDPAGAEDDDLVSVFSAAAGRQTDVLRVGGDDELQIPADNVSHLACASVESSHVVGGQHVMPLPRHQALSAVMRRSVFSSSSSCS